MAGPLTEAEELELLELELEEAQARVKPAKKSPFLQKGMNMVSGAQATPPQMRASLPAATEPDRLQNRTDSAVLAKARQVEADIANATRKARVGPVERAAGREGIAQLDQGPITANPNAAYSEFMLPPDAQRGMQAEREVYRENDVTSSVDAATIRGINSTLLGIPGIVNKDFRGELAAAGNDQPGASLAGDVAGFLAPGIGAWNTTRAGVNALARPFIPQGAGAAARGARYLVPRAGEVAGVAAQNAYFQGAIQEPIRAEQAGEDLTVGGMAGAAVQGFKDPLNLLPLGLSGANRTWNALTSGIATPSARAAQMANQFGVGPRQTTASQGIAQTTQQLGGQLQGADIRGLTNIENALRFALRDNPNIRDVNARIADGFQRIRQSLPLEDDPTLNLARLIEREFANDAPQTRDIIRRFLSKVGQETPGGEAIVGGAANDIRGRQADVLEREAYSVFGDQPKQDAKQVLEQNLDLLGEQTYAPIVREARSASPEAQQRATSLLNRRPETEDILFNRADREGLTVEQYVQRNPLEALHWVQSDLAKQARALRGANNPDTALEGVIQNMKTVLRDNVPNYREADALYASNARAFDRLGTTRGADAGTQGELKYDPGFGERLLGGGGSAPAAGRAEGRATARTVYDSMDEQSRRAAAISVRDIILDDLSKARAAGVDQRYEIAAKFQKLNSEGALQALVDVFGEDGQRIVNRIRQFVDANEFASAIDPMTGSNTMNKAQNLATGAQPFAGGMGQRAQGMSNALSESAIADSVLMLSGAPPIISAMRAPGIIGKMLQPGQRTQRNIASTLLRRGEIGSQVPPPPGGPPPITPIDPASVPGGQRTVGRNAPTPAPTNALSGLRSSEAGPIRASGFAGFGGRPANAFDPETPLFRGSDDAAGGLDGPQNPDGWHGAGIYLTTSADDAGKYSTRGAGKRAELMDDQIALAERAGDQEAVARLTAQRDRVAQPGTPSVKELRAQMKNPVTLDNDGGTVWQTADANRLIDALVSEVDDAGITYGASIGQKLRAQLQKDGRLTASDFERIVRAEADEDFIRAETSPGQVISQAYQALGHDGVVMKNASDVLPKGSTPKGTTHVTVFDKTLVTPPGTRSSGLSGLRTDASNAAVGGFIGFNQDQEPISMDNIGTKLRNAGIGAAIGGSARTLDDVVRIGTPRNALADTATAGIGGGGRGPRKPTVGKGGARSKAPNPDAIRESVRKVAEGIRAKGIEAKPQQPEMRVGKGISKLAGIKDNPMMGLKVASDMANAGRSADEIFDATGRVVIKLGGKDRFVKPPQGLTREQTIAAFWADMVKPHRLRSEWMKQGTPGLRSVAPDAIHTLPFNQRAQIVQKALDDPAPVFSSYNAVMEEVGLVPIFRGPDGQLVTPSKVPAEDGAVLVGFVDSDKYGFASYSDFKNKAKLALAEPYARRPKWFRAMFTDVLDAGSLRRVGKPEFAARRVDDAVTRRPVTAGSIAGVATGIPAGVYLASEAQANQKKNALTK